MLDVDDLRRLIMEKAHCLASGMHLGSTKIYQTIKDNYWWSGMKRDITEFVSRCLVCQQVKASETSWNPSSFTYSRMEVGTHHYRFHSWSTSYLDRLRCHLGDRGSTY